MSKKLLQMFIDGLGNKYNKRMVEWTVLISFQLIWIIISWLIYGIITLCSGWWLLLGIIASIAIIATSATLMYACGKVYLSVLYPPTSKTDANGDDNEDVLDKFNRLILEMNAQIEQN